MEKSLNTLYCRDCGSTHVLAKAWVDPNTEKFDSLVTNPPDVEDGWCENCEENVELATLETLWDDFSMIPINNNDEIEENFLCFDAGDSRFDVWHWFDERCPNGLAVDLMGETPKDKDALQE